MSAHQSRPPEVPRPSAIAAKNTLKNRLNFGGKAQTGPGFPGSKAFQSNQFQSVQMQNTEYQSMQFQSADFGASGLRPREIAPQYGGGAWTDQDNVHTADKNSVAINTGDIEQDLLSMVLGAGSSEQAADSSMVADNSVNMQSEVLAARKLHSSNTQALLERGHGNMTSILETQGFEDVANSMVSGEAGFCYVAVDDENPFKFAITNVPKNIQTDKFSTLSKYGLLRCSKDGSNEMEHTSLDRFVREHDLYSKLLELNIFKQYKLWKMFLVWNKNIKRSKFLRMKTELEPSLVFLDPDLRHLRTKAIDAVLHLQKMDVVSFDVNQVYDIQSFVESQRGLYERVTEERNRLRVALIEDLRKDGEVYICRECEDVPETVAKVGFNKTKGVAGTGGAGDTVSTLGATGGDKSANTEPPMPAYPYMDRILSYTERAKIRNKCRRLSNLFRVFDFMIRDALYLSCEFSLQKFQKSLEMACHVKEEARTAEALRLQELRERELELEREGISGETSGNEGSVRSSVVPVAPAATTKVARPPLLAASRANSYNTKRTGGKGVVVPKVKPCVGIFRVSLVLTQRSNSGRRPGYQVDDSVGSEDFGHTNIASITSDDRSDDAFVVGVEPSKEYFIKCMKDALQHCLAAGTYTHSLLLSHEFEPLLMPISSSEQRKCGLEDLIYSNKHNTLHNAINSCLTLFAQDISDCIEESMKYTHFAEKYTANIRYEEHLHEISTKMKLFVPEIIAHNMVRLGQENEEAQDMVKSADIGCMRIEMGKFQSTVVAQTAQCRAAIYSLTPQVFITEGSKLYQDVFKLHHELGTPPHTLDDFVRLMERFTWAEGDRERLTRQYEYIMDVDDLIEQFSISLLDRKAVEQKASLKTVWNQYTEVMASFQNGIDEHTKNFTREIKNRATKLQEPIRETEDRLHGDLLKSHLSDPDKVLREVHLLEIEFGHIHKKSVEIEHCQDVLNVNCFNSQSIGDMQEELVSHKILWEVMKSLKQLHHEFMNGSPKRPSFMDIDCDYVDEQVRSGLKRIIYEVHQENVDVRNHIDNIITELQLWSPIIRHLKSHTLQARHVERIHQIVGHVLLSVPTSTGSASMSASIAATVAAATITTTGGSIKAPLPPPVNTIAMLGEKGVLKYAADIAAIYNDSVCEYQLEMKIEDCLVQTAKNGFKIPDNKALQYIENIDELIVLCEDLSVTLNGALQSKYIAPHLITCQAALGQINQYLEVLQWIQRTMDLYLRFRILFTSTRTARYLPGALKHYKIVNENWRVINAAIKAEQTNAFDRGIPSIGLASINECIAECKEACVEAELTLAALTTYVMEQCVRWPKLYLCSTQEVLDYLTIQEPTKCYAACRSILLPRTTGLLFEEDPDAGSEVLPSSSGAPADAVNMKVSGVISGPETLRFRPGKTASYKLGFVEWLRALDSEIEDRIRNELKENIGENKFNSSLDIHNLNLHGNREQNETNSFSYLYCCCDQNRNSLIDVHFWRAVNHTQHSALGRKSLIPLQNTVHDDIHAYTSFAGLSAQAIEAAKVKGAMAEEIRHGDDYSALSLAKYHYFTATSVLLTLLHHRDLLSMLISDIEQLNSDVSFAKHCAIKKQWHAQGTLSGLIVAQGHLHFGYGNKYQGCGSRAVLTPLTNKCMLAISMAFQDHAVPFITNAQGGGKATMVSLLTDALGSDTVTMDCSQLHGYSNGQVLETIHSHIRASLSVTGALWMNVANAEKLPHHIFSCLMTQLSMVRSTMLSHIVPATPTPAANLRSSNALLSNANQTSSSHQIIKPSARFSICYNVGSFGLNSADCYLPALARTQFRPIAYAAPDYRIIYECLLQVHNFVFPHLVAARLDVLRDHLVRFAHVPFTMVNKLLIETINTVGPTLNSSMDVSTHTSLLGKYLFTHFHYLAIHDHIDHGTNLRDLCNTYFEMIFLKEIDYDDFSNTHMRHVAACQKAKNPVRRTAHVMIDGLLRECVDAEKTAGYNNARNAHTVQHVYDALMEHKHVLVYGDADCGKTSLIGRVVDAFISDFNATVSRYGELNPRDSRNTPARVELYPHVVNPLLLIPPRGANTSDCGSEFLCRDDCYESDDGVVALMLRSLSAVIEGIDTAEPNCTQVVIVEFPVSSRYLSSVMDWCMRRVVELRKRIIFVWEAVEIAHIAPQHFCNSDRLMFAYVRSYHNQHIHQHHKKHHNPHAKPHKHVIDFIGDIIAEYRYALGMRIGDSKRGQTFKKLFFDCVETYLRPCAASFDDWSGAEGGNLDGNHMVKTVEQLFANALQLVWKLVLYYMKKKRSFVHSNNSNLAPNPANFILANVNVNEINSNSQEESDSTQVNQIKALEQIDSPIGSPVRPTKGFDKQSAATPSPTRRVSSAAKMQAQKLLRAGEDNMKAGAAVRSTILGQKHTLNFSEFDNDYSMHVPNYDADSVHRLFIFAAIWTFGVATISSRKSFGRWFAKHFEKLHQADTPPAPVAAEESGSRSEVAGEGLGLSEASHQQSQREEFTPIFPRSLNDLFDYYLIRPDENHTKLSWIPFTSLFSAKEIQIQQQLESAGGSAASDVGGRVVASGVVAVARAMENVKQNLHTYSTCLHAAGESTVIIPTCTMQNARIIQKALAFATTIKEVHLPPPKGMGQHQARARGTLPFYSSYYKLDPRRNNNMLIVGESGSGKSSLLYCLSTDQLVQGNRWVSYTSEETRTSGRHAEYEQSSHFLPKNIGVYKLTNHHFTFVINSAKSHARPFRLENNWYDCGSIFVDDVNLPRSFSSHSSGATKTDMTEGSIGCLETLRYAVEHGHVYNTDRKRYERMDNCMSVLASSFNPYSASSGHTTSSRFVKYPHVIATDMAVISSVFSAKLLHLCPFLKESLCTDLILLTTKALHYFNADMVKKQTHRITGTIAGGGAGGAGAAGEAKEVDSEAITTEDETSSVIVSNHTHNISKFGFMCHTTTTTAGDSYVDVDTKFVDPVSSGMMLLKPCAFVLESLVRNVKIASNSYAVVTATEAFRMWDRALSAIVDGFPQGEKLWDSAVEEACQDYSEYTFPQFSDSYVRLLRKRADVKAKFISSPTIVGKDGEGGIPGGMENAMNALGEAKLYVGTLSMEQVQNRFNGELYKQELGNDNQQDLSGSTTGGGKTVSLLHRNDAVLSEQMRRSPHFWIDVQKLASLISIPTSSITSHADVQPGCLLLLSEDQTETVKLATSAMLNAACVTSRARYVLWDHVDVSLLRNEKILVSSVRTLLEENFGDQLVREYHLEQDEMQMLMSTSALVSKLAAVTEDEPAESEVDAAETEGDGETSKPQRPQRSLRMSFANNRTTRSFTGASDTGTDDGAAVTEGELKPTTVWHVPLHLAGLVLDQSTDSCAGIEMKIINMLNSVLGSAEAVLCGSFPALSDMLDVCTRSAQQSVEIKTKFSEFLSRQKLVFSVSTGSCPTGNQQRLGDDDSAYVEKSVSPVAVAMNTGLGVVLGGLATNFPLLRPYVNVVYTAADQYLLAGYSNLLLKHVPSMTTRYKLQDSIQDVTIYTMQYLLMCCSLKGPTNAKPVATAIHAYSPLMSKVACSAGYYNGTIATICRIYSSFTTFLTSESEEKRKERLADSKSDMDPCESILSRIFPTVLSSRYACLCPDIATQSDITGKLRKMLKDSRQWEFTDVAVIANNSDCCMSQACESQLLFSLLSISDSILDSKVTEKEKELVALEEEQDALYGEPIVGATGNKVQEEKLRRRQKQLAMHRVKSMRSALSFYAHEVTHELYRLAEFYSYVVDPKVFPECTGNVFSTFMIHVALNIYLHGCVRVHDTAGGFLCQLLCEIYSHFVGTSSASAAGKVTKTASVLCYNRCADEIIGTEMFSAVTPENVSAHASVHAQMNPLNPKSSVPAADSKTLDQCYVLYVGTAGSKPHGNYSIADSAVLQVSLNSDPLLTNVMMLYFMVVLLREEQMRQLLNTSSESTSGSAHSTLVKYWQRCRSLYASKLESSIDLSHEVHKQFKDACSQLNNVYFQSGSITGGIGWTINTGMRSMCRLIVSCTDVMGSEFSELMWKQFLTTMNVLLPIPLFYPAAAKGKNRNKSNGGHMIVQDAGLGSLDNGRTAPITDLVLAGLDPLPFAELLKTSVVVLLNTVHSLVSQIEYYAILTQVVLRSDIIDNSSGRQFMQVMHELLLDSFNHFTDSSDPAGLMGFACTLRDTDVQCEDFIADGDRYIEEQEDQRLPSEQEDGEPPMIAHSAQNVLHKVWKLCALYKHSLLVSAGQTQSVAANTSSSDDTVKRELAELLTDDDRLSKSLFWCAQLETPQFVGNHKKARSVQDKASLTGLPVWEYEQTGAETVKLTYVQKLVLTMIFKPLNVGTLFSMCLSELDYRLPNGCLTLNYVIDKLKHIAFVDSHPEGSKAVLTKRRTSAVAEASVTGTKKAFEANSNIYLSRDIECVEFRPHCFDYDNAVEVEEDEQTPTVTNKKPTRPSAAASSTPHKARKIFNAPAPLLFVSAAIRSTDSGKTEHNSSLLMECQLTADLTRVLAGNKIYQDGLAVSKAAREAKARDDAERDSPSPTHASPVSAVRKESKDAEHKPGGIPNLQIIQLSNAHTLKCTATAVAVAASTRSDANLSTGEQGDTNRGLIIAALTEKCRTLATMYEVFPNKLIKQFARNAPANSKPHGISAHIFSSDTLVNASDVDACVGSVPGDYDKYASGTSNVAFASLLSDIVTLPCARLEVAGKRRGCEKSISLDNVCVVSHDAGDEGMSSITGTTGRNMVDYNPQSSGIPLLTEAEHFVQLLRHSLHLLKELPIKASNEFCLVAIRIRWLLALFHVTAILRTRRAEAAHTGAIGSHLREGVLNYSSASVSHFCLIGDDTLVAAADCIDTLLNTTTTAKKESGPILPRFSTKLDNFAEEDEENEDEDDDDNAMARAAAAAAASFTSSFSGSGGAVHSVDSILEIALNNVEHLLGYIADTIYGNTVVGSPATATSLALDGISFANSLNSPQHNMRDILNCTFSLFFTPGCCSPNENYYLQSQLEIPVEMDEEHIEGFCYDITMAINNTFGFHELIGCNLSELHQRTVLTKIRPALIRVCKGMRVAEHKLQLPAPPTSGGGSADRQALILKLPKGVEAHKQYLTGISLFKINSTSTLTSFSRLNDVVSTISGIAHLFSTWIIITDSPEMREKTRTKSSSVINKQAKAPPPKRGGAAARAGSRRKVGIGGGLSLRGFKPPTREIEPLWTFLLMEANFNNRVLRSFIDHMQDLIAVLSTYDWVTISKYCFTHSTVFLLGNLIGHLLQGYVPHCWLNTASVHAIEAPSAVPLTLPSWLSEFQQKHSMLTNWIDKGYPHTNLQLHLLMNPYGFLQTVLEMHAWKNEGSAQNLSVEIKVLELGVPNSAAPDTASFNNFGGSRGVNGSTGATPEEKLIKLEQKIYKESDGLAFVAHNVKLVHAMWNEAKYSLEFPARYCTVQCVQNLSVRISAITGGIEMNDDDYRCPLYVNSSFANCDTVLPASGNGGIISQLGDKGSCVRDVAHENVSLRVSAPIGHVPFPTMENIEECACRNVSLVSSR